jgi:uncharacterized protein YdeI (YjbR/CyaY-like superfamily)
MARVCAHEERDQQEESAGRRILACKQNVAERIAETENDCYIHQAIQVEEAGLKVDFSKDRELDTPQELLNKFDERPPLKTAFKALTSGRQRGYLLYFSGAKRASARESRIEKNVHRILDGKGIHDCSRGLSRKLPKCDGSHKDIQQVNDSDIA